MSNANAMFLAAFVLCPDISWTWDDRISRVGWIGGIPGRLTPSSAVTVLEKRDRGATLEFLFALGMGNDAPKLFLDARLSV